MSSFKHLSCFHTDVHKNWNQYWSRGQILKVEQLSNLQGEKLQEDKIKTLHMFDHVREKMTQSRNQFNVWQQICVQFQAPHWSIYPSGGTLTSHHQVQNFGSCRTDDIHISLSCLQMFLNTFNLFLHWSCCVRNITRLH